MCRATEEYTRECKEIGREEGRIEGKIEGEKAGQQKEKINVAKRMLAAGTFTLEMITLASGLSMKAIQELQ